MRPGRFHGLTVLTVKNQNDTLIGRSVSRHAGSFDEKPHGGIVGIFLIDGQQDRMFACLRIPPSSVRQKRVVALGPKVSVKRLHALFGHALDHDAPAALERFMQERRQDLFGSLPLQMIEENFSHDNGT